MYGRRGTADLGAGRVPTAIRRARQTPASGPAGDDVTAADCAAIG